MPITDADRLAAAGAELTIAGHTFHVRYTARSLKLMEDEYGSIEAVGQHLVELQAGKGKVFSVIYSILALGLRHESVEGARVDEDWLLDNADPRESFGYAEVAFSALQEALPAAGEETVDPTTPLNGASPNGSTGHTSSGSRSDTTTSSLVSSGTK